MCNSVQFQSQTLNLVGSALVGWRVKAKVQSCFVLLAEFCRCPQWTWSLIFGCLCDKQVVLWYKYLLQNMLLFVYNIAGQNKPLLNKTKELPWMLSAVSGSRWSNAAVTEFIFLISSSWMMKTDILWIESSFVDRQVYQLETMFSVSGKLAAKVQLNEKIEAVVGKKQLFYSYAARISFTKFFSCIWLTSNRMVILCN